MPFQVRPRWLCFPRPRGPGHLHSTSKARVTATHLVMITLASSHRAGTTCPLHREESSREVPHGMCPLAQLGDAERSSPLPLAHWPQDTGSAPALPPAASALSPPWNASLVPTVPLTAKATPSLFWPLDRGLRRLRLCACQARLSCMVSTLVAGTSEGKVRMEASGRPSIARTPSKWRAPAYGQGRVRGHSRVRGSVTATCSPLSLVGIWARP